MALLESLKSLRDVNGVLGSFVLDEEGELVGRDMSQVFDDELLTEVGPRIRRMIEGMGESGESPKAMVLHFADHKLWLREVDKATVCVLGTPQVNRPALRMALTLVSRRVGSQVASSRSAVPPAVTLSTLPPPVSISGIPPQVAPMMMPANVTPIPPSMTLPNTLMSAQSPLMPQVAPHSEPPVTPVLPSLPSVPAAAAAPSQSSTPSTPTKRLYRGHPVG